MTGAQRVPGLESRRSMEIAVKGRWMDAHVNGKGMFSMWDMAAQDEPPWENRTTVCCESSFCMLR